MLTCLKYTEFLFVQTFAIFQLKCQLEFQPESCFLCSFNLKVHEIIPVTLHNNSPELTNAFCASPCRCLASMLLHILCQLFRLTNQPTKKKIRLFCHQKFQHGLMPKRKESKNGIFQLETITKSIFKNLSSISAFFHHEKKCHCLVLVFVWLQSHDTFLSRKLSICGHHERKR